MQTSYDITIIGTGVIGLTQAVALTQAGFQVAVVDEQTEEFGTASLHLPNSYDTRVFALNRYSQQILERLGIWQKFDPARIAAYPQVKLAFGLQKPQLNFNASDESEPNLGHIVEQTVWKKAALETLHASEYVKFFWGSPLKKIDLNHPLNTELLIGADGVHSKVRELCHIKTDTFACHQTALVFNIKTEQPHRFEARQYFCSQGIIAFLPLPEAHHYSIVWSIPNDQLWIKDLSDDALASTLNQLCTRAWGNISITSTRQSFPLIQQQARHYVLSNIALIGDAAHVIHPLAGQGANLGIADIAALTQQLLLARKNHRPLGNLTILKPYERTRRSAAWQMMGLMNGLNSFSNSSAFSYQALSYASSFLNRLPPLKNLLAQFALHNFTK